MRRRLLITDVDNTLFDWQLVWYETFSAMIRRVLEISGVDEEQLYSECSVIHQRYETSEYSHILEELPCLKRLYGDRILDVMQPAIDDFREARRQTLRLYPTVNETLSELASMGVVVAAFTESKAFYTNYRFRKFGLDGPISYLYSPRDHALPVADVSTIRKYEPETYELKQTQHRFTPEGETKPNPHILLTIIEELGFRPQEAIYVGDNVLKDVWMAQEAGVLDVHAAYGAAQHRPEYELLRKVTHWTPEMVERERTALKPGSVVPTHTLDRDFAQLLPLMNGGRHG